MTTDLRAALADYLKLRRGLGYGLRRDEKLIVQFLDYLDDLGRTAFTVDDALAWAKLPEPASPGWLGMRLSVVRSFAAYLHTLDPTVPVVPPGLLPSRGRRAVPYLYSDADLAALLQQTESLKTPLRTATMRTLIGLLAVTGMRLGEALAADDSDLDADAGVLVVRHAKFGKQRLLPLHDSTVAALTAYRAIRHAWFPTPVSPALLVSQAGTRLLVFNVGVTFARLARRAGLAPRSPSCRPRPHDLRHTFAVRTLLGWYRDGADIDTRLPLLSTYLGHVSPKNTYWYLDAAPELMAEAAQRLRSASGPRP
ncbi:MULTISPECIES: tyrosine-type recombinase/integrase [unclassified Micromonospora]|uniref:tyrosine-type recombinase/integrase n=1 Tax=unclassified Micromonospora TaxID=2617518 RepID=UPI003A870651